ncbi:MAG: UbiA family prenyltransferase [Bacteroidetes bacterium]|nr:UbiA family prenyltransferase [Bacteroidota bacterium]
MLFRLRQIPYLKIFLISFVWATVTILLPVIHSEKAYNNFHILTMIIERFLFVFAITIPFDIRDMNADSQTELKTIPLLIGEKRSIYASIIVLVLFFAVSIIHYSITNQWFILGAFSVSF